VFVADLDGVEIQVLRWDPEIMAALRARGARFADLPTELDRVIATLPGLDDEEVQATYAKLKRLYFAHVHDPLREQPFLRRARD
jgi:hypothetical protein